MDYSVVEKTDSKGNAEVGRSNSQKSDGVRDV